MESKKYTFNKADWQKIGIGALMALGGALVAYLTEILGQIDLGVYTPLIVAVFSIALNAGRKFFSGVR